MNIKARINKINQIAESETTQQIFSNDKMRRAYKVNSTRTDEPLQVKVDWSKGSELTAKVQLYTHNHKEQVNDAGNHRVDFNNSTVCYQALGILKFAAKQAGKCLSLAENKVNAIRLLNFGGELVKIVNLGGGVVWGVVR